MAERFILHIDMEGLLAALELRANPSLEGRRLVIGGMPDEPGIVVAHSRELRRAGIRPGMPLAEAAEIAPRAIFLPSRQRIYAEAHERVLRQLLAETDLVEPFALGEFFLDGQGRAANRAAAIEWGSSLRTSLHRAHGVEPAIGIGGDKLVARMCSGLQKGAAITFLDRSGFREAFWTRPLESLWGLGSRTIRSLRDLGMATIGDLGKTDPSTLAPYFGDRAMHLVGLAHGRSGSPVAPHDEEPRGPFIHRRWAAEAPAHSRVKLSRQISRLVDALSAALEQEHRLAERIEVAVLWEDYCETVRCASLDFPTADCEEILPWADALFRRFDLGGGVRSLGMTAARLSPAPVKAPAAAFSLTAPAAAA
jgi:DNA polymerase-4